MSVMGELTFFLGLQVLQKKDGIFLSQDKYVGEILKKFGYSDVRSMIGSLMYLTASRPDIMFAVYACARHQVTPKEYHLHAVKRIFRYLKDRKSTTGGCQFLGKRLISWQYNKQSIVATFITEAEYVAAASGHTQEEGIDYEEVFAPVARKEAIRLFLAYASFMSFMVYQMDVISTFLYGTIEEEVYVYQPLGFEDLDYPDKVYKVVKALYGLHQDLRAWYETLANYLLDNGFQRRKIDQTLFIKRQKAFEKLMKDKFQMSSMGELAFFLGLQVKQKKDGIFISQDKYVAEILRKFGLTDRKSASTPIDTEKPLLKDPDCEDVDVQTYISMIGSLMYLTSSRLDIMFVVCAYARCQVTPTASHLHAVKRIFRYLKGKPYLSLWYLKDSPFNLVAYSDSDYAGASLDKKFTTGGCQFLRCRLISWQCKKQIVMATSSTEAEYVATTSCCTQVLWIQNQLLDYGDRPPMLAPGRYPQWPSRFLQYVDTRPNDEALRKCILSGPYKPTTVLVQATEATDDSPVVPEHTTVKTPANITGNVGSNRKVTTRFYKLINEMIKNNLTVTTMQVNVQFLQQLQPEWSRFMTIVKQQHKLDEVSYHKLFDILKQYQNEVNELRAEKLARNANPLALVATAQASQDQYYQTSRSHRSSAPSPKSSIPSRSQTTTRHKGKEIAKPITHLSETASIEDSDPEQAQRDKDMQKNLALIAKYFKKIYEPTNNNLKTSLNSKNKDVGMTSQFKNDSQSGKFRNQRTVNVVAAREKVGSTVVKQSGIQCFNCWEFRHFAKECRKTKRVKDSVYHMEKMLLCKQVEQGVLLQAEQYDWLEDTNKEVDKQELEAHYSYMAKIQEVPTANSGIDSELVKQIVQLILFIVDSGCTKHMTGMVYYVKGLNHNLLSVGQFCDAGLEVAFRKSTCFVRDLQGNDLLTGNRRSDLYTISFQESTSSTPLCLMAKATPTQAWLWHRRLFHLNFDYINLISKKDIMIGLPKLKYVKDQPCSSCELSKAKRSSFKSKAVLSLKGRLNSLHMDLCGPMRVASINGKKYILVIVDDYSRYMV
nr:putative ribonuclease H-like domain-containing protein [Tanacetum cinerariifolium]